MHALLFVLICFVALYSGTIWGLVDQWYSDANYSHGFLIPFFSAFLAWQKREELKAIRHEGTSWGFLIILAGLGLFIIGEAGAGQFIMRCSLVIVLVGLLLFHLGFEFVRTLAFPICFLCFMIPPPDIFFYKLTFPLQEVAARNAEQTLRLIGIPILRDGNVIHLSQISLGVTEACSGIRSLFSLLAVAAAWAYIALPTAVSMLILIVSAVPIAIVANSARVVLTGMIGQWWGIEYAQGFFHTFSGWAMFLVAFACLGGVQSLIVGIRALKSRS